MACGCGSTQVDAVVVVLWMVVLAVGHIYSHSGGTGNGALQNQTMESGEHKCKANEQVEDDGKGESLAPDFDDDNHEGCDSDSVESLGDDDVIVDYQNWCFLSALVIQATH